MVTVFGLLGKSLKHSFSKTYFEQKFLALQLKEHSYENFELQNIEAFPELIKKNKFLKECFSFSVIFLPA